MDENFRLICLAGALLRVAQEYEGDPPGVDVMVFVKSAHEILLQASRLRLGVAEKPYSEATAAFMSSIEADQAIQVASFLSRGAGH